MRLRQLSAFIRVCQLGSITRAAADLNIAQPALGLQIRNLEAEFGADLIVRGPRGVRPTACGELVLAWAHEVLQSREGVRHRVREVAASAPSSLKLGLMPGVAAVISDRLLEWASAEPRPISLKIVKAFSGNISQLVERGQLDLGITCTSRPRPLIACTPLLTERLYFMSAPDGGSGPIPLADVLRQPLALPGSGDSIRRAVEDAARGAGHAIDCAIEINALDTARDLAAAGIAGSILPLGSALDGASANLSVRPIVTPPVTRTLRLVRRSDRLATEIEQRLIDVVIEALLALGDDPAIRPYKLPALVQTAAEAMAHGTGEPLT